VRANKAVGKIKEKTMNNETQIAMNHVDGNNPVQIETDELERIASTLAVGTSLRAGVMPPCRCNIHGAM
jgi:ribosomal protein S4E